MMTSHTRLCLLGAAIVSASFLVGCGKKQQQGKMPPQTVSIVTVKPERLGIVNELPGRLQAKRVAQVRARVSGIVLKRAFKEGSKVRKGQVLFQIDPALYEAKLASAKASLAKAEANEVQAGLKLKRYEPLVEINAISKQEFDDADAAHKLAVAEVAAAKASVKTARLDLGYARVSSPITGRIGRALVTEGALVGQGEATKLALVQQLDPMYVNLTQSSADLMKMRMAMQKGQYKKTPNGNAPVTLIMEDGSEYEHKGKLLFSDVTVDESTGMVTVRAIFPNPKGLLFPGTFVRARLQQAVNENALAVPQQSVQRTNSGAIVMVVGEKNIVMPRPVTTVATHGDKWIVSSGLKAGDRVIVEGLQKIRPGMPVQVVELGVKQKPKGASGAKPSGKHEAATKSPSKPAAEGESPNKPKFEVISAPKKEVADKPKLEVISVPKKDVADKPSDKPDSAAVKKANPVSIAGKSFKGPAFAGPQLENKSANNKQDTKEVVASKSVRK